jgi:hypothetical protein
VGDERPASLRPPAGAPKELDAFLGCTGNEVTLKNGKQPWIKLDLGFATLDGPPITFGKGADGGIDLTVGEGMISLTLKCNIVDGKLTVEPPDIPGVADKLKSQLDELNGWFAKNGKQLGAPKLEKGGITLTKVALAAPAKAVAPTPKAAPVPGGGGFEVPGRALGLGALLLAAVVTGVVLIGGNKGGSPAASSPASAAASVASASPASPAPSASAPSAPPSVAAASASNVIGPTIAIVGGAMQVNFVQSEFATHYKVQATDTAGRALAWSWVLEPPSDDPGCNNHGVLSGADAQFVWHHGDNDGCNHAKEGPTGHLGTVEVTVSDGLWSCVASFFGTQGNGSPDAKAFFSPCRQLTP